LGTGEEEETVHLESGPEWPGIQGFVPDKSWRSPLLEREVSKEEGRNRRRRRRICTG